MSGRRAAPGRPSYRATGSRPATRVPAAECSPRAAARARHRDPKPAQLTPHGRGLAVASTRAVVLLMLGSAGYAQVSSAPQRDTAAEEPAGTEVPVALPVLDLPQLDPPALEAAMVAGAAPKVIRRLREEAAAEARARARALARKLAEARAEARERAVRNAIRDPRSVARIMVSERGWGSGQFGCLDSLWNRESRWNYTATNPSSGAYGIPQSLPGGKMASAGADWRTNPVTQIRWGLDYIADRYGTPCGAWSHSEAYGWY